jgi:hypothetical protein
VDVNLQRLDQDPSPPPPFFPSMEEGWHPYRAEFPVERHQLRGSKDAKKQSRICTRVTPFRMELSWLLPWAEVQTQDDLLLKLTAVSPSKPWRHALRIKGGSEM